LLLNYGHRLSMTTIDYLNSVIVLDINSLMTVSGSIMILCRASLPLSVLMLRSNTEKPLHFVVIYF
jgi:hypothetical protein